MAMKQSLCEGQNWPVIIIADQNVCVHSGVITNSGGKVIVRKMAGQNIYKGSNSNGVRSLSLPKWRESFVVSGNKQTNNIQRSSVE